MSLAQPIIGAVNPLPNFPEDRGTVRFDPTTKSTLQDPSVFAKEDTCGRETYVSISDAVSLNENIDCTPTLASTMSISALFPVGVSRNEITGELDGRATPAQVLAAMDAHYATLRANIELELNVLPALDIA